MSATPGVRSFHESYVWYEEHMSARCDNDISQSQMVMEETPILSKLYTKDIKTPFTSGNQPKMSERRAFLSQKCLNEKWKFGRNIK